jgi:hypothetical protein
VHDAVTDGLGRPQLLHGGGELLLGNPAALDDEIAARQQLVRLVEEAELEAA